MNLLKKPKNLYFSWIKGNEYEYSYLVTEIDEAMAEAQKLFQYYAKQKMQIAWEDYIKIIEGFIKRIFSNIRLFTDYANTSKIMIYNDLWNEDNYYVSYICKSLQGYFQTHQKKYYGLSNLSINSKYTFDRCHSCGKLYKKTKHNQKYCRDCKNKNKQRKGLICVSCGQVYDLKYKEHKKDLCRHCYEQLKKSKERTQAKIRMKNFRERNI